MTPQSSTLADVAGKPRVSALALFALTALMASAALQFWLEGVVLTATALACAAVVQAVWAAFGLSPWHTRSVQSEPEDRSREISRLAHDLRTHLAIITMQLNKIPDPGARSAEADIRALTDSVDRLADAARLRHGSTP